MSSRESRDYYKYLFSSDSETSAPTGKTLGSDDKSTSIACETIVHQDNQSEDFFIENIKDLLESHDVNKEVQGNTIYFEDGDSDMSISTSSSKSSSDVSISPQHSDIDEREFSKHTGTFATSQTAALKATQVSLDDIEDASLSSLESVDSEMKKELLLNKSEQIRDNRNAYFHRVLQRVKKAEAEVIQTHYDMVGTINVQNKYDHSTAAQLFLEGNFAFLSIQEPFAHQEGVAKSWQAFRRNELQSARICCFETNHQIILYDSWKWGGKVIADFESKLNGRITSIAFGFGKNQKLGIISVYAMARGGSVSKEEEDRKEQLRKTTVFLIKKLYKSWMRKFPGMQIMILGDMQETCSISDRDNLGTTRLANTEANGIVAAFRDSHVSIVRDRNPACAYLTRFGNKGARGIDHILFPNNQRANSLIHNAGIDTDNLGNSHFASDHKLIHCTYIRRDSNNEEQGESVTRFAFNKISKIKVKRVGNKKDKLIMDDSQFKGSSIFKEQADLYAKLQDLSSDNSEASDFYLADLEHHIKKLYASLWKTGKKQGMCGEENKLVRITENHAADLSQMINRFELGIEDIMTFLNLTHESDCFSGGAVTRNTIRLKNGDFKVFSNLPVATKLRYLRANVQQKRRKIESYKKLIEEIQLNSSHQDGKLLSEKVGVILKTWNKTVQVKAIRDKANLISSCYFREEEERQQHMQAIDSKKVASKADSEDSDKGGKLESQESGNKFEFVSESTVKLINLWLGQSGCNQGFHSTSSHHKFDFLKSDELCEWQKDCMEIDWGKITSGESFGSLEETLAQLSLAQQKLRVIEGKLSLAQVKYRSESLLYLLKVNQIENFTKKVLLKARDVPATHTEIWDEDAREYRKCRSDVEELVATGQFHGNWMGKSKAPEACAFATLRKEGLLGNQGIILTPERKVTMDDVPKLVHNGKMLSKKLKKAFVRAHGSHTARLFQQPKVEHKSLHFPFFLTDTSGNMNRGDEFEESFWKSLASVPGKARYNGFHMAVVGRFGKRWQRCLLEITKLILIMRFVPNKLKTISRFPIPKPGRVNEYRPISLCHDMYCYINAICTNITSKGIEEAKILHSGISAYIKGRGCTNLVGVEQGVREDCIESGIPSSQTDEDEEKFFDRIPVEVLLAAMRVNGFPEQGFLELKASGMDSKTVEIITGKGIAHARFVCGIEQGNPDSPAMANLVIKFKHDLWKNILDSIDDGDTTSSTSKTIRNVHNRDAYKLHITDDADGVVAIDRIGYCDDNSRYTSSLNEDDVIRATRFYIQQAGDLSLVTKIGRKGSKSEIHYFNLSAEKALSVKQVESIAWSFKVDGPQVENVPHKICLQDTELQKVFKITEFHRMDSEKQQDLLNIFQPKAHKHLGLKSELNGNSCLARKEVMKNVKARMASLRIHNMERQAQQTCVNMLCNTVHSYAPLQMNHQGHDLQECDEEMIKIVRKRHGLAASDAKHVLFLPENKGGFGFKSYLDIDVIANAREVEIGLNGEMLDSEVMRARSKAFIIRHNNPSNKISFNYMGSAINKLAKFGFHVRDRKDGIINYILAILNKQKRFCTIGDVRYTGMSNYSIGNGQIRNLDIAYGSKLHLFLKTAITSEGTLKSNSQIPESWKLPTSLSVIQRSLREAKGQMFDDVANCYSCWEWSRNVEIESADRDIKNINNWTYINVPLLLKKKLGIRWWNMDSAQLHEQAIEVLNNRGMKAAMGKLLASESPIFISTDGSHVSSSNINERDTKSTTGAAVICILDLKKGEDLGEAKWINRPAIPILARASRLPGAFGNTETDISHGEGVALCMGLEMFCVSIPKIFIMDSAVIRSTALKIRNKKGKFAKDRMYIRKIASGVSKHLCQRLEMSLQSSKADVNLRNTFKSKQSHTMEFLDLSKSWTVNTTKEDEQEEQGWKLKYWDKHVSNTILKVDSHQLDGRGLAIKAKPRYKTLVPNLFLLSCNHFADVGADLLHSHHFAKKQHIPNLIIPPSKLRFFLTCNGAGIDKHVSECISAAFQEARVHELCKRHTQGLPWRIISQSTIRWPDLQRNKGLFRSLRGLSRTHTRSLYKSTTYRQGWIKEEMSKVSKEELLCLPVSSSSKWIEILSTCRWCDNGAKAKGNRYHAALFCEEPKLLKYRNNMTMLLEQRLHSFVRLIGTTQNVGAANIFLNEIEQTLSSLHSTSAITGSINSMEDKYWNRNRWMEEENMHSMEELLNSEIPIYGMIFGFNPISERIYTSDKDLTPALCIPLGITNSSVETQIKLMIRNLKRVHADKSTCKQIELQYWNCWKEIKEIVTARMVGIHRIIGNVSHDFESMFRKKYNLDVNTFKEGVSKASLQGSVDKEISTTNDNTQVKENDRKKRKYVKSESNLTENNEKESFKRRKYCSGVTCNPQFRLWNFDFKPNEIDSEKKHCQRCSRHQTAIRKSIAVLKACEKSEKEEASQDLVQHLDASSNTPEYAKISMQLSQFESDGTLGKQGKVIEKRKPAIKRKRQGVPEDRKTMIKVIATSISRLTEKNSNPTKRIRSATESLIGINARIETFLKDDLRDTKNINKRVLSLSCNKKHTVEGPDTSASGQKDARTTTDLQQFSKNEEAVRKDIAHTLGANQWMHSFSMDRAIKFIRDIIPEGVYIADTFISTMLQNWRNTDSWERVAAAFRKKEVIFLKPNGVYIIPIFTGCSSQGHWSMAVIHKDVASCRGWILDSLGNSNLTSNPAKAIKSIFSSARRKFKWIRVQCKSQVEVECGSRTIVAMVSIVRSISNRTDIERAIASATLMQSSDYDASEIRSRAAACMRLSSDGMERDRRREQDIRRYLKEARKRAQRRREIESRQDEGQREIIKIVEDD